MNSKPVVKIEVDREEELVDAASLNKKPLGLSATINRIKEMSSTLNIKLVLIIDKEILLST